MTITREILEEREKKYLAPYAIKSRKSLGRKFKEKDGEKRLCFQKDRDRILHSKSFRRLDEKTQVFIAGSGDHYRTRLTHTLEVSQIGRDIARRMGLNEDLCEAIALAHDLGHPPFGHSGENALNEVMKDFGMHFEHNEQSKRIVETLEKSYPDFDGLNLTFEVLGGLIKHQTAWDQSGKKFEVFPHLEAQVVNIADEIAYTNHDIDDGLRSGIINLGSLEKIELWRKAKIKVFKRFSKKIDEPVFVSRMVSAIISLMIEDFCDQTEKNIKKFHIKTVENVLNYKGKLANFSPKMISMVKELRLFLYDKFYMSKEINKFISKGKTMITKLFKFYVDNPKKFPKISLVKDNKDLIIRIKDYIAGMTDGFLIKEYNKISKK